MYAKIEPSGCDVRKGMVQIRLSMYLEPADYGYDKHYVEVPVVPEEGYPGEVNDRGIPIDLEHYNAWFAGLPRVWQNNPFHNHFIYVNPDTSDEEVVEIAKAFLQECYIKWAQDYDLVSAEHQPRNDSLPFKRPRIVTKKRISNCTGRLESIRALSSSKIEV